MKFRFNLNGPTRRGLAPVELVLCLPLLLCVMALMVNFGTAVCWKVRASTNSRNAVWRARWPRSGHRDGHPAKWPPTAAMGVAPGQRLDRLAVPEIERPVVRGPIPNGFAVDAELLDTRRGLRDGTADVKRTMPMLPKLGTFEFHLKHPLLDDAWQFQRMHIGQNVSRRIPIIYTLPLTDPSLPAAFVNAVQQVVFAPLRDALRPLDHDEDFIRFSGHAPDFHPHIGGFCSLEIETVRAGEVERLIHRIKGHCVTSGNRTRIVASSVPLRMTDAFIGLYQAKLDELKAAMQSPQPSPALTAQFVLIPELEQKISQLKAFRPHAEQRILEECDQR